MSELKDPFSKYLINQYAEAIFLNKDLDILYIHGDLESILSLPNAIFKLNLEKMITPKDLLVFLGGVRAALDAPQAHRIEQVIFQKGKSEIACNLTFQVAEIPEIREDIVLITFDFLKTKNKKPKIVQHHSNNYDDHIMRLEKELKASKQKIKNLESDQTKKLNQFNNKNRELSLGNEELQSTNEELQSVNEELHTVNAELQHKNIQLSIANDDIDNLLKATNIGTIFLDEELNIRKFTPAVKKQFNILDTDIGRSITSFTHNLKAVKVEDWCQEVYETSQPIIKLVSSNEGMDFLLRIYPYQTVKDKTEGVVIAVIDLYKTKTLLQKYDKSIQEMAHKFDAIYKYSHDPMIFVDNEGKITSVNKAFKTNVSGDVIGESIYNFVEGENQTAGFKKVFKKVIKTLDSQNYTISYQDDPTAPVLHFRLNLIPIPDNETKKVKTVNIIAQQITEEINYQETLEEVKDTFIGFMANASHLMVLINRKGKIIYINSVMYSSHDIEEIIGANIYDFLPPNELPEFKKPIEEVFAGKPNNKFTFKYTNPEEIVTIITLTATPVIVREKIAYVALIGEPL